MLSNSSEFYDQSTVDLCKFRNPLTAAFTSMSGDEDGAMCFKTCGMEGAMKDVSILTKDISHSLATAELCLIITTIVLCICLLSLTITTVCVLIRKHWTSAKRRQTGSGVDYDTRSMVSNEYAEPAWQIPIKKLEALVPPPPGKNWTKGGWIWYMQMFNRATTTMCILFNNKFA